MHLMRYSNVSPSRSGRSRGWPVWLSISVTFGDLPPYGPGSRQGLGLRQRSADADLGRTQAARVLLRVLDRGELLVALGQRLLVGSADPDRAGEHAFPVVDRDR